MSTAPVVSILIPTFNQDLVLLRECIDSALAQTFQDIEVVVSDNHSTNGMREVLDAYVDPRLRVVSPPQFVSMSDNFDFCATQARGTFLSFLSSDDLLLPAAIEVLHRLLIVNPGVVFACGNIYRARKLPGPRSRHRSLLRPYGSGFRTYFGGDAAAFFFPWKMSSTWMAGDVILRHAYESTGGLSRCTYRIAGDVWLTEELLKVGGFLCVDEPLALFRSRSIVASEVDRDRRLFDLEDAIVLAATEPFMQTRRRRLRQVATLVYRLGVQHPPTPGAIQKVESKFAEIGRPDLVRLVNLHRRCGLCFRLLGQCLSLLHLCRRVLRSLGPGR